MARLRYAIRGSGKEENRAAKALCCLVTKRRCIVRPCEAMKCSETAQHREAEMAEAKQRHCIDTMCSARQVKAVAMDSKERQRQRGDKLCNAKEMRRWA